MNTVKKSTLALAIASSFITLPSAYAEELSNNLEDLEIIVISASRTEKHLNDVAGSISVVSSEDLEKYVISDMNQLFKYDPSVVVTGGAGGAQNFTVRGMGGDRILMIKDGMRMNEGYGANGSNDIVGRGFIETDTLKQVEVAKGAASSLYGSDALGGIVVFTTKNASDYLNEGEVFAGDVKLGYNSDGEQSNIGTTLALETGSFEHLLNVNVRDGEEEQNYYNTKPALDISSTSVLFKSKFNINKDDSLNFIADVWQQDVDGLTANGLLQHFRGLTGYDIVKENSSSEKENQSFQLQYHNESGTALFDMANISLYSNNTKQTDAEYGQIDINANFGHPVVELRDMYKTGIYKQDTIGLLSNASLRLNDTHTLGYGLDVEKSTSSRMVEKLYAVDGMPKNGYPKSEDKFPETEVLRAGLFINDEISLLDNKLLITPGARFDTYDMDPSGAAQADGTAYKSYDESHVSFNLGALYKFNDMAVIFAQYGQGFKVPAYDLAYIDHDNSLYGYKIVAAADDLEPEESDSFEIGLRGHQGNLIYNAAIFYAQYDNFLEAELIGTEVFTSPYTGQPSNIEVYQYQNIDAVTIKGAELGLEYLMNDSFSLYLNTAYQDGTDDETGDYINTISPLSGNVGINYDSESFSTELILNWADKMSKVNAGDTKVSGYGSLDWVFNMEITDNLRFNLLVTNIFDKEYVRYNNVAGHAANSSLDFSTESGREFSAIIKYAF
ncbi:MAG: TonB-dependent hemoglobin/transferrin/lactoferrin family receptor [Colwellia sp.]|nr:TonB-dependent hemoglobin/transferrin/lactoferrin family receptor [Colwellia sp.]